MTSKRTKNSAESVSLKKKKCLDHSNDYQLELNSQIADSSFKELVKDWFTTDKGDVSTEQGELVSNPFKCCFLQNFLDLNSIPELIEDLQDRLLDLELLEKNNDLYKFCQTDDLKKCSDPILQALKKFICGPFQQWVMDVTGIEFNSAPDISCSVYRHTDALLCHNDKLMHRRIAFVLYLVPDWLPEDGGALDLFSVGGDSQPDAIVRSLVPKRNSLVFFEVTPTSFHQVAEVTSKDKTRLSVNGWFHGVPVHKTPDHVFPLPTQHLPGFVEESKLYEWINAPYLEEKKWKEIQKQFEENSEIQLSNFLNTEKYEEVKQALAACKFSSSSSGPANLRHYQAVDETCLPPIVDECRKIFTSEALLLCLSHMTGLRLHHLAPKDEQDEDSESSTEECGKYVCEVRQWRSGNYTLVHDNDKSNQGFALDARVTFNCEDWSSDMGGYVSYIARDEDEELMTVNPEPNALALVYRDKETVKFVKHVNSTCHKPFQDIALVYYE